MNEPQTSEYRFLQATHPSNVIVVLIEAYIDESGTGDSDPVHCLAGYLLKLGHGPEMARKWKRELDRYGIEFFHMTDCAAYERCEPYKSLGRNKCIRLATALIKLIKRHCYEGFAVCFSPQFYSAYDDKHIQSTNQYANSVGVMHHHIQACLKNIGHDGAVSYVFEAGHRHQRQARAVLDRLHDDAELENISFSSSFQNKREAILLQAADILAWHCQTYIKRKIRGNNVRADFKSLLEIPHRIYHFSNLHRDGLKDPGTTAITVDFYPELEAPSIEGLIKAIYLLDEPIPA